MVSNFSDLDKLSDEEIKQLYEGIIALRRTRAGYKLVQDSIEKIRSGQLAEKPLSFEVPINFGEDQ